MQRDPLGYADGMNLYEYCSSNPPKNIDPFGLFDKKTWDSIFESNLTLLQMVNAYVAKELSDLQAADLSGGKHKGEKYNALRHCIWSCLMCKLNGEDAARKEGIDYEDRTYDYNVWIDETPIQIANVDKAVDLRNN
jgi:hypothetical protein